MTDPQKYTGAGLPDPSPPPQMSSQPAGESADRQDSFGGSSGGSGYLDTSSEWEPGTQSFNDGIMLLSNAISQELQATIWFKVSLAQHDWAKFEGHAATLLQNFGASLLAQPHRLTEDLQPASYEPGAHAAADLLSRHSLLISRRIWLSVNPNDSDTPVISQQSTTIEWVEQTKTKTPTLKALPTVRDHTTDQVNAAGDEYLPREIDASGEKKIASNGTLEGGRAYKIRTFLVPNRGDKLFMLATECARVLGYRDTYLLFNKNRSLFKIIASQAEKDDLVAQEILPYSYRSRQIAIVAARSMFRQFGSRVIENGRRVRDDYWESKARKQGFTEEDHASKTKDSDSRPSKSNDYRILHPALPFLLSGDPFDEFVVGLRRVLYDMHPPAMEVVRQGLLAANDATKNGCEVLITTNWSWSKFLANHYEGDDDIPLGSVFTMTGLASCAIGTSCREYVRSTWESNGLLFLEALEESLQFDLGYQKIAIGRMEVEIRGSVTSNVKVKAHGPVDMVIRLVQQLSWMSTALQTAPSGSPRAMYCLPDASIARRTSGQLDINLTRAFVPVPESENTSSCWLKLVDESVVIAAHFRVPMREKEQGLELPLSVLADWVGVQHVVEFEGGIVMKGPSAMLVPTGQEELGRIIQWHVVVSERGERLTYHDGLAQCKQRALLSEVNLESLKDSRIIVGWCSEAISAVGTKDVDYSALQFSTAGPPTVKPHFSSGAIGIQQIGTAQINCRLSRKISTTHHKREGNYRDVLRHACKEKIILYDTEDSRAWLTDAEEVLLHMMRARDAQDNFKSNGSPSAITCGRDTRDTMEKNSRLVLYDCEPDEKDLLWSHLVSRYWSLIDLCRADVTTAASRDGWTAQDPGTIFGFEFMMVVEERRAEPKEQTIKTDTSGGWAKLVQNLNALVLFGSGFGDLIRPAADSRHKICEAIQKMPTGKDHLATTVRILLDLYRVTGYKDTPRLYLTPEHLWWRRREGSFLFEECPDLSQCSCQRLQKIGSGSWHTNIAAPPNLETEALTGAVIFGEEPTFRKLRRKSVDATTTSSGEQKRGKQQQEVEEIKGSRPWLREIEFHMKRRDYKLKGKDIAAESVSDRTSPPKR